MLEARNLIKTYQSGAEEFKALDDVSLKIKEGDCVAIVGKSGRGKSTLMHLLACLDKPSSGVINFENEDVSTFNETRLNRFRNETFGFVFQQFFLNGRETVLENVLLPLRIRGAENFERIYKAMQYLEAVGLKEKADKKAKDLSGGEKQRVCIARALVSEPKIIFADEPTGNLDSSTGAMVEEILFKLNREKQIALIFVTHDADLADKCPRMLELKDGKIVAERLFPKAKYVQNTAPLFS